MTSTGAACLAATATSPRNSCMARPPERH
jgi:hypothetical protein